MNEKYLVINAGSSSLKFSLYSMPDAKEIVNGYVQKIGYEDSFYLLKYNGKKEQKNAVIMNHKDAISIMLNELLENNFINNISEIKGIGHRVVHGGEKYSNSVIITDEVIEDIDELTKFATLHHPGEIAGIKGMQSILPEVPQVAVFDTAFHQTMPKENYLYAVPYSWYEEKGVRKYGFHGTSHKYITEVMQKETGKIAVNFINCHIGNGSSICAVKNGKCFNTTMGLTPLDGLIMGTRCGSIDPSILNFICNENNLTIQEVTDMLNNQSGLLGIAGKSDFRDLEALASSGDEKAKLAIKMLRNSIVKSIAQYYVELNGQVDAIVFTAGIGENSFMLRAEIMKSLSEALGIELDRAANDNIASFKENQQGLISTPNSKIKVMVIPTNEEYMILRDTYELTEQLKRDKQNRTLKNNK